MEYLFTTAYMPFTVAIIIMIGIGLIEAFGLGLSTIDLHLDVDADGGVLDYLGIGHVPLIMVLVAFLSLFGLSGLILQNTIHETMGEPFPLFVAIPVSLAITLPLLGGFSRLLGRVMPKDETTAIGLDELLGKRAKVLLGYAQPGSATRAEITDYHGQRHYILVEPDRGTVSEGDELILVRREGDIFVGTPPHSTEFKPII